MARSMLVALAAAGLLAGCGGGGGNKQAATAIAPTLPTTTIDKCNGAKSAVVRVRKEHRLDRDLVRLRTVASTIKTRTLNGTPALDTALDRFLVDVATRDVPVHLRSRYIDRAAAIVSPLCEQCFQALEASRPTGGGANLGCG
jgi:hypothetical protein